MTNLSIFSSPEQGLDLRKRTSERDGGLSAVAKCSAAFSLLRKTGAGIIMFLLLHLPGVFAQTSGACGTNLTWTLYDGVLTISGTGAMTNYTSQTNVPWYSNRGNIQSVVLSSAMTNIGNYAFFDCYNLTGTITIPAEVTNIGNYAFYGCSQISGAMVIPDKVTNIGSNAFYNSGIQSVTISENVTSIGTYAFHGCSSLETVNFNAINCNSFGSTTNQTTCAFYNLSSIKTLNIGENVTRIPNYAFYGCSGITAINIPNSVTSLGQEAFRGCSGATSLSIGTGITTIPTYAFYGCRNISSVTIHEDVTSIGTYAFHGCSSLETVNFNAINCTTFGSTTNQTVCAFYNLSSIKTLNIGESVTRIPNYAFYGCSGITAINIPNSVTSLGQEAFRGCSGATSLSIGTGITTIPTYAFFNCSNIPSVTIPEGVTSIGTYAFHGCSSLETINFNAINCTTFGSTTNQTVCAFYNLSSIKTLNIGENVTNIPNYAFYGCSGITAINIPNSVTSLGQEAFRGCSGATSLSIGAGITTIPTYAFFNCGNIPSVTIPEGITSIGQYAFHGCSSLETVNFNAINCTTFGSATNQTTCAFYNLSSIKTLNIGENVTNIPNYAFYGCSGITAIDIPNSVTSLGQYAFYGCSGATSIDIPNSVISLGQSAFERCTEATYLSIGSGLTTIPGSAFQGCSNIQVITIGENVSSIAANAFGGCTALTTVYSLNTTPPTANANSFSGVTLGNVRLYVPNNSLNAYRTASVWQNFFQVQPLSNIVTFFPNNGEPSFDEEVFINIGTIEEPAGLTHPDEWVLVGWYTNPDTWSNASKWDFVNDRVTANTGLHARWVDPDDVFTVTFDADNETTPVQINLIKGDKAQAPQAPSKTGYTFDSWYNGNVIWDFDIAVPQSMTLTAGWLIVSYNIEYNLTGGVNHENNPSTYTIESAEIELLEPTRENYIFAGWEEGSVIATGSHGDKTFTAQWDAVVYNITYILNDGENHAGNPATYTVEDEITLQNPILAGFAGSWLEGNNIALGSTGNKTFTAQWLEIELNSVITFPATDITSGSAVICGEIDGVGYFQRGIVLSVISNYPGLQTSDRIVRYDDTEGTGAYCVTITGLLPSESYYARAFVISGEDVTYSDNVVFFTTRHASNYYTIESLSFETELPAFAKLLVQVRDHEGKGANWLENEDFIVVEDNEIDQFGNPKQSTEIHKYTRKMEETPPEINTVLVLDYTASLNAGGNLDKMRAAAIELIDSKSENQKFAILMFADNYKWVQEEFTDDKALLIQKIEEEDRTLGSSTRLFAAYMEGISKVPPDVTTTDFISRNFMVIFTDGLDASFNQAYATGLQQLQNAANTRQGRRVFTVGLTGANDITPQDEAYQEQTFVDLASPGDNYSVDDAGRIGEMFTRIQSEIKRDANSLYRLTYLSPKREREDHQLRLMIKNNSNTSANSFVQEVFDARDFESVKYGVFVNPYDDGSDAYGLTFGNLSNGDILHAVTYWADLVPQYRWLSSDTTIVALRKVDFEKVRLVFKQSGQVTLSVRDTTNYNQVKSGQNATIESYYANAFERRFAVNSTGSSGSITLDGSNIHTVTFRTGGGIPVPSSQEIQNGKVREPAIEPVTSDYNFTGWYNEGALWDFDADVAGDMILTAGWQAKPELKVLTLAPSYVQKTSATFAGVISERDDGSLPYWTERGFCYSTSLDPTVSDNKITVDGSASEFQINASSLSAGTIHYVRAYAINAQQEVIYGDNVPFTTRNSEDRYHFTGYSDDPLRYKPSFVELLVSVKDGFGKGADYLEENDFIFRHGTSTYNKQSEFFNYVRKMDAIPFRIKTVLMLDNSSSIGYDIEEMKQAAIELIRSKHEKQEFAVFTFSDDPVLIQDFTTNANLLIQRISEIEMGSSSTNLYGSYIEGMKKLPPEFSSSELIEKCFFVMLSDGDETRNIFTPQLENDAVNSRFYYNDLGVRIEKSAYMIGLGQDLQTARLTKLASGNNYHHAVNLNEVKRIFAEIQYDIMREANSFYNLTCMSNMREEDGVIELELSIVNNINTGADRSYLTNFTSIGKIAEDGISHWGTWLNVYEQHDGISIATLNKYGLALPDVMTTPIATEIRDVFAMPDAFLLKAITYGTYEKPHYVWTSSNPDVATVTVEEGLGFGQAILRYTGDSEEEAVITVKDVTNYEAVYTDKYMGSVPQRDYPFFERSIRVRGMLLPAVITSTTLPGGILGGTYSHSLTAEGKSPIEWTLVVGTLPDGLTLSTNGIISGTPTVEGTFIFTIKAANDIGEDEKELFIVVSDGSSITAPVITTTALSSGTAGTTYNATLVASGDAPVWSLISGALPAGLTLSAAGTISGSPTTTGTFTFTVSATNSAGSDSKELSVTISKGDGAVVPAPTVAGVGATSVTVNAVAAPANGQEVEYAIDESNIAPFSVGGGIVKSSEGGWQTATTFTGLTANTIYYIFARSKENDSFNAGVASASLSVLTNATASAPEITTTDLVQGTIGDVYNATLAASGEAPVWTVTAGNLPTGLTLSSGGVISGTPAVADTFYFTVNAANDLGDDSMDLNIIINKSEGAIIASAPTLGGNGATSITINAAPAPDNGQEVEYFISEDNVAPTSSGIIKLSDNGWQTGLTFTGLSPNTTYYIFARSKENDIYYAGAVSLALVVTTNATAMPPVITTAATLSEGKADAAYSVVIVASGDAPFTWSITAGTLPDGLTLNPTTGEISGTPEAAGTHTFTVSVANDLGDDTRVFTLTIAEATETPVVLSVAVSPQTATVKTGATEQFTANVEVEGGAAQTVEWSVAGSSNSGTGISTTGVLTVAADETATTLIVRATSTVDANKWNEATVTVTADVTPAVISVTVAPKTVTVEKGKTQLFTATVVVEGGAAQTVTWSVNGHASTNIDATGLLTVALAETAQTLTVTATSTVDNSKSDVATVTVANVTSSEVLFAADLNIYPNPFTGEVRITGAAATLTMGHAPLLQVINAAGAIVHTQTLAGDDVTINFEHLPAGVYIFRFEQDGDVSSVRVVKE